MHNPQIVVAVAVYLTVQFIGQAIGMSTSGGVKRAHPDVIRNRVHATITATVLAVAACVAFAAATHAKWRTVTFWANLAILLFGGIFAVYMVYPKLSAERPRSSAAERKKVQTASLITHSVALGATLVTYGLAAKLLSPLDRFGG
jgi:hypothetical protein